MKAAAVERKVCTRCGMDGHRASHCPHPLARARVSAAGWNDRCTDCMEGQGRAYHCRKPSGPLLSDRAWLLLVWAADLAVVATLAVWAWRAWA